MEFIEDLPDEDVQPVETYLNSEYLVVRQWDGTGEMEHCVLIPRNSVVFDELAALIQRAKAS